MKRKITYSLTVLLSLLFIFFSNRFLCRDLPAYSQNPEIRFVRSRIVQIIQRTATPIDIGSGPMEAITIKFAAQIDAGEHKGELVYGIQNISPVHPVDLKEAEAGDKVLLFEDPDAEGDVRWLLGEYIRSDGLLILGIIFALLLILFGRIKGINTLISLALTCGSIFLVLIPAILAGKNIYFWSIAVCIFITAMTLIIVNGTNSKSLTAGLGCLGGITLAGILTVIMDHVLVLTGYVDDDSIYLLYLNEQNPIDLRAIVFAAILIGAIGAIMDVAVDIAASLHEISRQVETVTMRQLIRSGFTIGRDILGTMSNTLVLAYIGGSLTTVLLIIAYNGNSLLSLFNMEMIVVELLQALVGSFGILFSIPFTTVIGAYFYTRRRQKPAEDDFCNHLPEKVVEDILPEEETVRSIVDIIEKEKQQE